MYTPSLNEVPICFHEPKDSVTACDILPRPQDIRTLDVITRAVLGFVSDAERIADHPTQYTGCSTAVYDVLNESDPTSKEKRITRRKANSTG